MNRNMRSSDNMKSRVEAVLSEIRDYLREDGGDVEFAGYDENEHICQLRPIGNCVRCPLWLMTLRGGIERYITMRIPEIRRVETAR